MAPPPDDPAAAAAADLVARAARGDAAAFELLIARHERLALAAAYGSLQDAQLARDVCQEAFVKAWRHLADLGDPARFAPWLCGIVRNLCADHRRRKRPVTCDLETAHDRTDARAPDPADELGRRETGRRVAAALDSLDEVTRSAMVLRYYDNLSSREIADLLGTSASAIDMRLMRGRQALRGKLAMEVAP